MLSSSAVPRNQIVSRAEWLAARRALLAREKQATRLRDQINAERLALPWVRVEQDYVFDTPGWAPQPCRAVLRPQPVASSTTSCWGRTGRPDARAAPSSPTTWTARCRIWSTTTSALSRYPRAPLAKIMDYKTRMGWRFPWVSSFGSDFNFDFGVSFTPRTAAGSARSPTTSPRSTAPKRHDELPGLSAFFKDEAGAVFHTYSSYARGLEELIGTLMILDRAPMGRNEKTTMDFVRRHDEYEAAPVARSCCAESAQV